MKKGLCTIGEGSSNIVTFVNTVSGLPQRDLPQVSRMTVPKDNGNSQTFQELLDTGSQLIIII